MEFDVWSQEDADQGAAMRAYGYPSGGLSSALVSTYPDSIPAGTAPTYSNGFSMTDFTGALKSVSDSVVGVAKTVYGLETGANQLSLQRLQTAAAIDVTKAQTAAARDVALAESMTATAKAQATLKAAQQSAQLQGQLGFSMTDLLILAGLGFAVFKFSGAGR